MNFAVRHTTCCVSAVLLISLSPVFIEIQNMNFAVRHTTCCVSACTPDFFVSQVFIEIQNMNFAVRHTTCCVSAVLLISLSLQYSLRYKT